MKIDQVQSLLEKARWTRDELKRARTFLRAQRLAAQSRSRRAYEIETWAHLGAVMGLARGQAAGLSQEALSELGQIKAESQFRFSAGGTPSRTAIVAA